MSVKGMDELQRNFKQLADKYGKAVAHATVQGGQLVRTTAIQSIQQQSNGNEVTRYRLGGGSYQHIASKPGDPPNTDTGALVRSINVEIRPDATYVGTSIKYAPYLEFGTARMAERPWLNPALENNKARITRMIRQAMRGVS